VDLRYPVGQYSAPSTIRRAELDAWISDLEALPGNLRKAVEGLNDDQLDMRYRPGGWTLRQVVHHIPDGHVNAYTRFRLALTEDAPMVKPFEESAWAELSDAKSGRIEPSLALTDALHRRWVMLLRSLCHCIKLRSLPGLGMYVTQMRTGVSGPSPKRRISSIEVGFVRLSGTWARRAESSNRPI
jgi:hypothetical protein